MTGNQLNDDLREHMNRHLQRLALKPNKSYEVFRLPTSAKTDDGSPTMKESACVDQPPVLTNVVKIEASL